ncbi:UNVERIFIED_CONTAM: hypothetical protein PYX00_011931 [Menopon gallinae]|uniref:Helicase n=1 Tax=Menopon gallinae TaxID=328185 RepID=A0AAW2H8T6_9NEOP
MLFYRTSSNHLPQQVPSLIKTYHSLKEKAQALPADEKDKEYVIMRIDYVLATLYEVESDNPKDKRSYNLLSSYIPCVKTYLKDKHKTSEEKRILADIVLRVVRCLSFGKMVDMAARGQIYLFTPRFAGGSLDKAKEYLLRSQTLSQERKDACGLFLSYLWLSQWAMKQKDQQAYKEYIQKLDNSVYAHSWLLEQAKERNNRGKLLDTFSVALEQAFKSHSSLLALCAFAQIPLALPYKKPLYLLNSTCAQELLGYEQGQAYVVLDEKKAFFLSFEWDHLYQYKQDLECSEHFLKDLGALKRIDLWQKQSKSKSLRMGKVCSGEDLLRLVAQASCFFVQQEKKAIIQEARFALLLPLTHYSYLREPASSVAYCSIQEELAERLATQVWLSPLLHQEAILLWYESLLPSLAIQPLYFLGLDEQGKRKLWFYFKESQACQTLPHLLIRFKTTGIQHYIDLKNMEFVGLKEYKEANLEEPYAWLYPSRLLFKEVLGQLKKAKKEEQDIFTLIINTDTHVPPVAGKLELSTPSAKPHAFEALASLGLKE